MSMESFFLVAVIFIAFMLIYRYLDRWVSQLPAETVKTINRVGFWFALLSGILWYILKDPIYMFLTLAGVVVYFLFYNYDKEEKKED